MELRGAGVFVVLGKLLTRIQIVAIAAIVRKVIAIASDAFNFYAIPLSVSIPLA